MNEPPVDYANVDNERSSRVGYIPLTSKPANLYRQLVSSGYERASVIVTSNKPSPKLGRSAATPPWPPHDRPTRHHTDVVALRGDSHRLEGVRFRSALTDDYCRSMSHQDQHLEFLLHSASALVQDQTGTALPQMQEDLSWSTVWSHSSKLRMNPLLGLLFERAPDLRPPPWLAEAAAVSRRYFASRCARLSSLAADIHDALEAAGVPHAFRKGIVLHTLYPEPACRPFSDIDLYVPKPHVPLAERVLDELGYGERPYDRTQRTFFRVATNYLPARHKASLNDDDHVYVDVATSLCLPSWGTVPVEIGPDRSTGGLPTLSSELSLLDVLLNHTVGCTTLHYIHRLRFQRIVPYLDTMLLARSLDDDRLQQFKEVVTTHDLEALIAPRLTECIDLFPDSRTMLRGLLSTPPLGEAECDAASFQDQRTSAYVWRHSLRERLVLDRLPADVPHVDSPL